MPENTGAADEGPEFRASQSTVLRLAEQIDNVARILETDDELIAAMIAGQIQNQRLLDMQARIVSQLSRIYESQQREDGLVGRFPLDMSHTVDPDTPVSEPIERTRTPNEGGPSRIEAITLGWSSGTDNGTGIRIETGDGLQLVPRNPEDNFVAFDDFVQTFEMDYDLEPGEEIVSKTVNFDQQNPHFVNIVPHISEYEDTVAENAPVGQGGDE